MQKPTEKQLKVFLLVDTGQNDQNRLVSFATVGNLEKFYEAETIYIDRTFKASMHARLLSIKRRMMLIV